MWQSFPFHIVAHVHLDHPGLDHLVHLMCYLFHFLHCLALLCRGLKIEICCSLHLDPKAHIHVVLKLDLIFLFVNAYFKA